MARLLEDTRVLNSRKGSKVRFYFSDGGSEDLDVPHFYAIRVSDADAYEIRRKLKNDLGYDVKVVGSGYRKSALQIAVPREDRDAVEGVDEKSFAKSARYSTEDVVRMQFPPYSYIEIENGVPKVVGRAGPEEILREIVATDIELRRTPPDNKYNEIVMNATAADDSVHAVVLKEFGVHAFPGVIVDPCANENEIGRVSSEILRKYPRIAAHNLPFDFERLRDRAGDNFASYDEYAPSLKKIGNFLKIFKLRGKALLDTCAFSRNHLPLIRDKLEPVFNYYFEEGYEKSIDYDEMDGLLLLAAGGKDPKSAEIVIKYNIDDVIKCLKLAKREAEVAAPCALALATDLTSFFSLALSNLAKKRRDLQYFRELHAFRGNRAVELQDFDYQKEKFKFLEGNGLEVITRTGSLGGTLMAYPTQILQSMPRMKDDAIGRLYDLMKTGDERDRIIYAQVLDALCEEPFMDMLRCEFPDKYYYKMKDHEHLETLKERSAEKAKWSFRAAYGESPEIVLARLKGSVEESAALLEMNGLAPVNAAGRFYFLQGNLGADMDDTNHFIVYGASDWTLSIAKGHVAARMDRNLFGFGLDTIGNRGPRCEFEKEMIAEYFETYSERGAAEAAEVLKRGREKLNEGKVGKEQLAYKLVGDDKRHSIQYYKTRAAKMKQDVRLSKGEEALVVLCKDGSKIKARRLEEADEVDLEEYDRIMFGADGTVSRYRTEPGSQSFIENW